MPSRSILVLIVCGFQARRSKIRRWRISPHRLAGYITLITAVIGLLIKLTEL